MILYCFFLVFISIFISLNFGYTVIKLFFNALIGPSAVIEYTLCMQGADPGVHLCIGVGARFADFI